MIKNTIEALSLLDTDQTEQIDKLNKKRVDMENVIRLVFNLQ